MNEQQLLSQLLTHFSPEQLTEQLANHLTGNRIARINNLLEARLNSIDIAIESPSDPHNAAAVVRSAEVFGLTNVHVINAEGRALQAKRTTQGAFYWLQCNYHEDINDFIQQRQQQGFKVYGAALDQKIELQQLDLQQPCCLLFGNEQRGLTPQAQQACNQLFSIPMYGMSESLNLSVAAAISLYDVTRRKRKLLQANGDLSNEQKIALRLQYYAHSVDIRLLKALLKT